MDMRSKKYHARIISVSGDSGTGKTTICNTLKSLFINNTVLHFETDRYHKWERNDPRWKDKSHLNPESNYIEQFENDLCSLKKGNDIFVVDYDHTTGKFTPISRIQSTENILVCGLHTFVSKKLIELSDIKIFIDTELELKTEWKIKRDLRERQYSLNDIVEQIKKRKPDYDKFILPQRQTADIIIKYTKHNLIISIRKELYKASIEELRPVIKHVDETVWVTLTFDDPNFIIDVNPFSLIKFESGYSGIIQYIVNSLYI
jgi:phosphoribulokinase